MFFHSLKYFRLLNSVFYSHCVSVGVLRDVSSKIFWKSREDSNSVCSYAKLSSLHFAEA